MEATIFAESLNSTKLEKCKIIVHENIMELFHDKNKLFTDNISKLILIIDNKNDDRKYLKILFPDFCFWISLLTSAEIESWYYKLSTVKHQEYSCINFEPLHKWRHLKKRERQKLMTCSVCENTITTNKQVVICNICSIISHESHLLELKATCKLRYNNEDNIQNNHQWINNYLNAGSLSCCVCNTKSDSTSPFVKCMWCCKLLHKKCTPSLNFGCNEYLQRFILHPSDVKVNNKCLMIKQESSSLWPLFIFINLRGGKCKGVEFSNLLRIVLNPIQIWDIPFMLDEGLRAIKNLSQMKILICGGDGTVGWVMSEIQKVGLNPSNVLISVLPLGTGNDFSRTFGWGSHFDDASKIGKILKWLDYSTPIPFDCWKVSIHRESKTSSNISLDSSKILLEEIKYLYSLSKNRMTYFSYKLQHKNGEIREVIKEISDFLTAIINKFNETIHRHKKMPVEYIDFIMLEGKIKHLEQYNYLLKSKFSLKTNNHVVESTNMLHKRRWSLELMPLSNVLSGSLFKSHSISNRLRFSFGSLNEERTIENISNIIVQINNVLSQLSKSILQDDIVDEYEIRGINTVNGIVTLNGGTTVIPKCYLNSFSSQESSNTDIQPVDKSYIMCNYLGIGLDAKIALEFHKSRTKHPALFESRVFNKFYYGILGSKEFFSNSCEYLEKYISLECDGIPIKLPPMQALIVLNIPSYMSGIHYWGSNAGNFLPQSYSDGILDITHASHIKQLSNSRIFGGPTSNRIAQCRMIKITIHEGSLPLHIDGEAYTMNGPCSIIISHQSKFCVLKKPQKSSDLIYLISRTKPSLTTRINQATSLMNAINNLIKDIHRQLDILLSSSTFINKLHKLYDTYLFHIQQNNENIDWFSYSRQLISYYHGFNILYNTYQIENKLIKKYGQRNNVLEIRQILCEMENKISSILCVCKKLQSYC